MRRDVICKGAYDYPSLLKNEIEYLHYKLHKFDKDESLLENPSYLKETRFEKLFTMGHLTGNYKAMVKEQTGLIIKDNIKEVLHKGNRFIVIVEGG